MSENTTDETTTTDMQSQAVGDDTTTDMDNNEASDESDDSEDTTPVEDNTDTDDNEETGNREAAKYRRKLRDVEAERDTLATRLQTLQRAEAERLASKILGKPAALWASGTDVHDLLDDGGDLDVERITARAREIRDEFGIAPPRKALHVAREGNTPQADSGGNDMLDVVMGRRNG